MLQAYQSDINLLYKRHFAHFFAVHKKFYSVKISHR